MKVLVTGAGLVGAALARRLAQENHEVSVFALAPRRGDLAVGQIQGDLRDPEAVRGAVEGAEGVFHTAALHSVHFASFSNQDFMDINVTGTYNVLEAAAAGRRPPGSCTA